VSNNNKTITITIPHRLSQDECRARLQKGITDLKAQHAASIAQVAETWSGNQMSFKLTAMGQAITGRVDVQPSAVKLDIDLPWMLAMFAEKFRPRIEQEGRKMLEEKK
jgi:hypothetical protein